MNRKIKNIRAREILDSRGDPTVEVRVELENGIAARGSVPSGASTGTHEALELRDGDKKRYRGKGVLKACRNVEKKIAPKLRSFDVTKQKEIDRLMLDLDGTTNKRKLGANAILAVSMACAKVGAKAKDLPLYRYIRQTYGLRYKGYRLPTPLVNVINGGKHADSDLDLQEFIIVPVGPKTFAKKAQAGSEIFHALGDVLKKEKLDTDVGNEGGYAPNVGKTTRAFDLIMKAIKLAGYKAGRDIKLGIDAAASEFYNDSARKYILRTDKLRMNARQLMDLYEKWFIKYPFLSIEDPLSEDDWENWQIFTREMKKKILIIGDDLFVTNVKRLKSGIELGVANAILIKVNQIGSLSETIETIKLAQKNKYKVVISHRSGETCDDFIADLAVAVNAEYAKIGCLSRSERVSKYNRLMQIEKEL